MEDIRITIVEDDLPFRDPKLISGLFEVWGDPTRADARVICASKVIAIVEEQARGTKHEVGGILLGEAFRSEGILYIEISECLLADDKAKTRSSAVHFEFTPAIWAEMLRQKDQRYENLRIVGWFHSHPGHGIFLSPNMDDRIQDKFFNQAWQTAMVFDPVRHEGGFFIWQGRETVPAPGFYERFPPDHRRSVVSWRNLERKSSEASSPVQAPIEAKSSRSKGLLWPRIALLALIFTLFGLTNLNMERLTRNLQGWISANGIRMDNLRMEVEKTTGVRATEVSTQKQAVEALMTSVVTMQNAQATQAVEVHTLQTQLATSQALIRLLSTPATTTTPTATRTATPTATPEPPTATATTFSTAIPTSNTPSASPTAIAATPSPETGASTSFPTGTRSVTTTPDQGITSTSEVGSERGTSTVSP